MDHLTQVAHERPLVVLIKLQILHQCTDVLFHFQKGSVKLVLCAQKGRLAVRQNTSKIKCLSVVCQLLLFHVSDNVLCQRNM